MNDQDDGWKTFKSEMAKQGVCTNFAIQQLWIKECAEAEAAKFKEARTYEGGDAKAIIVKATKQERSPPSVIEKVGRRVSELAMGFGATSNHRGKPPSTKTNPKVATPAIKLPSDAPHQRSEALNEVYERIRRVPSTKTNPKVATPAIKLPYGAHQRSEALNEVYERIRRVPKTTAPSLAQPSLLDNKRDADLRTAIETLYKDQKYSKNQPRTVYFLPCTTTKKLQTEERDHRLVRLPHDSRFFQKSKPEGRRSLLQRRTSVRTIDTSATGRASLLSIFSSNYKVGHYTSSSSSKGEQGDNEQSSLPLFISTAFLKTESTRKASFLDDTAHRVLNKLTFVKPSWEDTNGPEDDMVATQSSKPKEQDCRPVFSELAGPATGCLDDQLPASLDASIVSTDDEDQCAACFFSKDNITGSRSYNLLELMNAECPGAGTSDNTSFLPEPSIQSVSLTEFSRQEYLSRELDNSDLVFALSSSTIASEYNSDLEFDLFTEDDSSEYLTEDDSNCSTCYENAVVSSKTMRAVAASEEDDACFSIGNEDGESVAACFRDCE